jgi:hypothetical protein
MMWRMLHRLAAWLTPIGPDQRQAARAWRSTVARQFWSR